MLGKIFQGKSDHPLADAGELRRVLHELPADNAFRSLDEIMGWLESCEAGDLAGFTRFSIVRQLDEAAQPHLKRLARDYLHSPRLSRSEERRLWTIIHGFWEVVARQYECCLEGAEAKDRNGEQLKPHLPLLTARIIAALGTALKWQHFRYGPVQGDHWVRMGRPYLLAERLGFSGKTLQMYPGQGGVASPAGEYLKVLLFQSSSLDCLLPLEIELAERLIAHLLPDFILTRESGPGSVYWVDAARPMPPVRLAQLPDTLAPTLRFFQPGEAENRLLALIREIERGNEVPASLNLGGSYPAKTVLPVMRHLASYWAPVPPQRQHVRHRVKHRVAVLPGLVNAFVVFSPEFGGKPMGLPLESWIVENVSRGGFGATVQEIKGDWLKVGALLALQPEGAENWVVGVVRRYHRVSDQEAQVGIETLSRRIASVEIRPRAASSYAIDAGAPGLWLQDDNPQGEVRFVLPVHTFDVRESLEFDYNGRRVFLAPVALLEQGGDYEVARYRATVAAPAAIGGRGAQA